jgi:hypothetical protein
MMIYTLVPHENTGGIRVFGSFGMAEQIAIQHARSRREWGLSPDWCYIVGYETGTDEYAPIWIWYVGAEGTLVRESFIR